MLLIRTAAPPAPHSEPMGWQEQRKEKPTASSQHAVHHTVWAALSNSPGCCPPANLKPHANATPVKGYDPRHPDATAGARWLAGQAWPARAKLSQASYHRVLAWRFESLPAINKGR